MRVGLLRSGRVFVAIPALTESISDSLIKRNRIDAFLLGIKISRFRLFTFEPENIATVDVIHDKERLLFAHLTADAEERCARVVFGVIAEVAALYDGVGFGCPCTVVSRLLPCHPGGRLPCFCCVGTFDDSYCDDEDDGAVKKAQRDPPEKTIHFIPPDR